MHLCRAMRPGVHGRHGHRDGDVDRIDVERWRVGVLLQVSNRKTRSKWKLIFIKNHMPRDDDASRLYIHAAIAPMVGCVTKENTGDRTRRPFVWHSSSGVRVTQTAESADMRVSGNHRKKGEKGTWRENSFSGDAIEEVCGGVKGFNPESRRHVGLK